MIVLRFITITLDVVFLFMLSFFMRGLRWSEPEERISLIGFGWMMLAFILNIALVVFL